MVYRQPTFTTILDQSAPTSVEELPSSDLPLVSIDPFNVVEVLCQIYVCGYNNGAVVEIPRLVREDMAIVSEYGPLSIALCGPYEPRFPYIGEVINTFRELIDGVNHELETSWDPTEFSVVANSLPVSYSDIEVLRRHVHEVTFRFFDSIQRAGEVDEVDKIYEFIYPDMLIGYLLQMYLIHMEGKVKHSSIAQPQPAST